jgi:hypothetical protein
MKKLLLPIMLFSAGGISAQKVNPVQYEDQADVKVFVEKYESLAGLEIFYVNHPLQAG